MSLRLRNTIRLGRYARITASKSGLSVGFGPRDANFNLSRRGIRSTVGIPGSGVSYQRSRAWRRRGGRGAPVRSSHIGAVIVLVVILWAAAKLLGAG